MTPERDSRCTHTVTNTVPLDPPRTTISEESTFLDLESTLTSANLASTAAETTITTHIMDIQALTNTTQNSVPSRITMRRAVTDPAAGDPTRLDPAAVDLDTAVMDFPPLGNSSSGFSPYPQSSSYWPASPSAKRCPSRMP